MKISEFFFRKGQDVDEFVSALRRVHIADSFIDHRYAVAEVGGECVLIESVDPYEVIRSVINDYIDIYGEVNVEVGNACSGIIIRSCEHDDSDVQLLRICEDLSDDELFNNIISMNKEKQ